MIVPITRSLTLLITINQSLMALNKRVRLMGRRFSILKLAIYGVVIFLVYKNFAKIKSMVMGIFNKNTITP